RRVQDLDAAGRGGEQTPGDRRPGGRRARAGADHPHAHAPHRCAAGPGATDGPHPGVVLNFLAKSASSAYPESASSYSVNSKSTMTTPDLTLYYTPGTCAQAVRIALEEAG